LNNPTAEQPNFVPMTTTAALLHEAEQKALQLFTVAAERGLIAPHQTEKELNTRMYDLAFELFGIRKFWHKRIVRSGPNTLLPYKENPPDLLIGEDDILFFDFGPVFEDWEADVGKTYVIGNDPLKHKLAADTEAVWYEAQAFYRQHADTLTGAQLYAQVAQLARQYGWGFGNVHCGHLIGQFPHEVIEGEKKINYLHPENHILLSAPGQSGKRYWILEIHLVDTERQIGGFFEQIMNLEEGNDE
jgi:Xaa-Pro dipeptidase